VGDGVTVKVERLVNLTVAFLEARKPMTFAEIRGRTRFYDQDDAESARRMFERDKDDLRRLGVPVEVRDIPFSEDVGYVVDRRTYELPDVDLTADEVAALALAVQTTGGAGAHLPLAKLAARAPDPAALAADVPTRVTIEPAPVDELAEAVVRRTPLSFTYRTAGGDTARRTVDPYAVVQRRSAWYLVAHDHDRDARRAFRLDRIVDRPRAVGQPGAFTPPEQLDVAAAVAGPDAEPVVVELAVAPDARWAVEVRGAVDTGRMAGDRPVLRLEALDPQRDLAWLLGFGEDVEVLHPPELRRAVVRALDRVIAAAGDRA
jgi:proteasome accessory factor B